MHASLLPTPNGAWAIPAEHSRFSHAVCVRLGLCFCSSVRLRVCVRCRVCNDSRLFQTSWFTFKFENYYKHVDAQPLAAVVHSIQSNIVINPDYQQKSFFQVLILLDKVAILVNFVNKNLFVFFR